MDAWYREVWSYVVWAVAVVLLVVCIGFLYSGDCSDDMPIWLLWGFAAVVVLGWVAAFLRQWHNFPVALVFALVGTVIVVMAFYGTLASAFVNKCAA